MGFFRHGRIFSRLHFNLVIFLQTMVETFTSLTLRSAARLFNRDRYVVKRHQRKGMMLFSTGAARTLTYTANSLNKYTARTVPGWASVRGLADADATVTVNSNLAYALASGDLAYFFGSDDFDNSVAGGFAELEVSAVVSDGINDFVSVATNRVFVPPANETYAYDADGNMTEDARFRYYWNGENRMIRAEEKSAPSGRQPYVIAYAYDHMGRNVIKDGAKFIWDDYNIIIEDAASSNATFNTWGLDIDGTMQGAGGVGGLLAVEKGDAVYLPAYDANGNVTEYVTVDGVVAAHYAHSAFGKALMAEDSIGFSHRFSTKPYCPKTGLVEFEFRKYAPNVGRWMSRDPLCEEIETEFGSIDIGVALVEPSNQYCGIGNNAVGHIDTDGRLVQAIPIAIKVVQFAVVVAGAAAAATVATELVEKCPRPECNPCDPPVGTKGYRFEQVPPGKPHWPISGSHVHVYEVNQSPIYKGCRCFWKNMNITLSSDSPPIGMVNIKKQPSERWGH